MSEISSIPLILLAGGKSKRAGSPKGLLPYRGRPWIYAQVSAFRGMGGNEIFLVLGYDAQAYREAKLPEVHLALNPHPEHGPFSSIQAGVRAALDQGHSCAFILPIDVPAPEASVWLSLAQAQVPGVRICQPVIAREGNEHGGHPVLLDRSEMDHLLEMKPTDRLDLRIHELSPAELSRVPVQDERVIMNLNTPESWERFARSEDSGDSAV